MREFGARYPGSQSGAQGLSARSARGVKRDLSPVGDKKYWAIDDTCEAHGLRL